MPEESKSKASMSMDEESKCSVEPLETEAVGTRDSNDDGNFIVRCVDVWVRACAVDGTQRACISPATCQHTARAHSGTHFMQCQATMPKHIGQLLFIIFVSRRISYLLFIEILSCLSVLRARAYSKSDSAEMNSN